MNRSKLFLARCVIETSSPLALHSGNRELGFDSQLARDWNNLPYIPATSIAGVWRSTISDSGSASKWFGSDKKSGTASRISISDGLMLNSESRYFPCLAGKKEMQDKLFAMYSEDRSEIRDRCRISNRGVTQHEGKFDVAVLPSGIRFVFDIKAELETDDEINELRKLICSFRNGNISLGSGITNGQGTIKLVGYKELPLDLKTIKAEELIDRINNFRKEENVPCEIKSLEQYNTESSNLLLAELHMRGRDSWRIGNILNNKRTCCYKEKSLTWKGSKMEGTEEKIIVLGSTLKGIIAHRTDFHYRKLKQKNGQNVQISQEDQLCKSPISPELEILFGTAGDKEKNAKAGNLIVNDTVVRSSSEVDRTHVKIDRFSGGAYEGALFNEMRLYKPEMTFTIHLRQKIADSMVAEALYRTITDIIEGFLPISSGSGRQAGLLEPMKDHIFNRELLEVKE